MTSITATTDATSPDGPLVKFLTSPGDSLHQLLAATHRLAAAALPWALGAMATTGLAAAALLIVARRRQAALGTGARLVTVLSPPEVHSAGGEALWHHLHALLRPKWRQLLAGQPHLAFEYAWDERGLTIRLWIPRGVPAGLVERAIEAAWPGARTDTTPVDPPLPDHAAIAAGQLRLARPDWFPLRAAFSADPLRALLGAASPDGTGKAAVVQILARPAGVAATHRCRRAARRLRAGQEPRRLAGFFDLVTPGPPMRPGIDPAVASEVRDIVAKSQAPLWTVAVRYAVANLTTAPARRVRSELASRAHIVAAAFSLYAGPNQLVRRRLRRPAATLASRRLGRGQLLSTLELAALAHLPLDRIVPGLAHAGARPVPPPPAVLSAERVGKVLGDAVVGGSRPVVLRPADACYHVHLMGATGSGKSTLLGRLILDDARAGRGAVVIDPKGDLVTDVVAHLDASLRSRVTLLDPQGAADPPALNILEQPDGISHDLVVDHLVGIFSRIFDAYWGPRLEDVLRSATLTLLQRPGATLSDIPTLLSHRGGWERFLQGSDHTELQGFWHWYDGLSDAARAQVVGPLLYKLRAFLLRPFVRRVVNAPRSTIDVSRILDQGGLLLVRIPKGILGEDTARLLGSFVVAKVWQATLARASLSPHQRRDAGVYVDECHNFVTTLPRSFDEVLAEARGYRVSFVLAHQHLGQLPRELRESISANARNKIFFTMSPEDAGTLARHTIPQLTDYDLAHLGPYHAACRLVVSGHEEPAFTLATRPLPSLPDAR